MKPRRSMQGSHSHEHGQELVEYALLLPTFLMLLMVILDMGRAVYYFSALQNAARAGARYGILHPADSSGISSAAKNAVAGLNPADMTVTPNVTITPGFATPDTVKVTVRFHFSLLTPLVGTLVGSDQIFLHSSATMALEQ